MASKLHILIVEDLPSDAELMEYELQSEGIKFLSKRVDKEEDFLFALSEFKPDIILSDYSLPAFDGEKALALAKDLAPRVPLIFVTGALGEELAIELLKKGATDYVLKSRLTRLPFAVSRALREVEERKERDGAQASLRHTEELLKKVATAVEQTAEGVMITNKEGAVEYVNPAFTRITGYAHDDIVGRSYSILQSKEHSHGFNDTVWRTLKTGETWKGQVARKKKDGSPYDMEETISPVIDSSGNVVNCVFVGRDITERTQAEEKLKQSEQALRVSQDDLRRLAGKLLSAEEEERRRVARELHDDFTQRLAALSIDAGKLEHELSGACPAAVPSVEKLKEGMVQLSEDVHQLSRQLHPSILDDLGLVKAVESECARFSKQEGINVRLRTQDVPAQIAKEVAIGIYRIIQETLRNAAKHSQAKEIYVSLTGKGGSLFLSVTDEGVGFNTKEAKGKAGMGLASIGERIRLLSGELSIESTPGKGTSISAKVPLKKRD